MNYNYNDLMNLKFHKLQELKKEKLKELFDITYKKNILIANILSLQGMIILENQKDKKDEDA
jgi:hypothetical protein